LGPSVLISAGWYYTFVDERNLFWHSLVFSAAECESAYVIDGLMRNDVVKSDIHSTDTHGFSEAIFAVTHLLGCGEFWRGLERCQSGIIFRRLLPSHCPLRIPTKPTSMCGKPVWSGFRTLPHSDMICRAYFWPPASRFSRFWRPAGKQVFPSPPPLPHQTVGKQNLLFFI